MVPYNPDDPNQISNWFDPYNETCMKAWVELGKKGWWPEWFQKIIDEENIIINQNWQMTITAKLAQCWVDHFNSKK
jgi:hypothetical protein